MGRITKQRDDRRAEFLKTAKKLFNKKGYEHTTVDDIVDEMGVAKGLFYYYFESKEALLDAITTKLIDDIKAAVIDATSREDLPVMAKMERFLTVSGDIKLRSIALITYFHEPRNKHLHLLIEQRVMEFLVPAMEKLIEQGVREGVFDTKNPHCSALAYLGAARAIGHDAIEGRSKKEILEMVTAYQTLAERMLGARPGTFDIYQRLTKEGLAKVTSSGYGSFWKSKR